MANMINKGGEEAQDNGGEEIQGEGVHIENEPLNFEDDLTQQGRLHKRRQSQWSGAYMEEARVMIIVIERDVYMICV